MTPQQHDRLLMLLRNDNWSMADQIHIMNLVRQESPATLRDEFAQAALTGMRVDWVDVTVQEVQQISETAYVFADALLEARKS